MHNARLFCAPERHLCKSPCGSEKLADAIGSSGERLAAAISADFGHRSRHETEIGEIFPAQSAIRHTLRHVARWMRPKRVAVGFELMPASARILYQPVGVVGSSVRGIIRSTSPSCRWSRRSPPATA